VQSQERKDKQTEPEQLETTAEMKNPKVQANKAGYKIAGAIISKGNLHVIQSMSADTITAKLWTPVATDPSATTVTMSYPEMYKHWKPATMPKMSEIKLNADMHPLSSKGWLLQVCVGVVSKALYTMCQQEQYSSSVYCTKDPYSMYATDKIKKDELKLIPSSKVIDNKKIGSRSVPVRCVWDGVANELLYIHMMLKLPKDDEDCKAEQWVAPFWLAKPAKENGVLSLSYDLVNEGDFKIFIPFFKNKAPINAFSEITYDEADFKNYMPPAEISKKRKAS
jgi:hypothetical protein